MSVYQYSFECRHGKRMGENGWVGENLWIYEKQSLQRNNVKLNTLSFATWYCATMKSQTILVYYYYYYYYHYLFLQPLISSLTCMVICFWNNEMQKFLLEWKTFTPWNIIHLSSYITSMTLHTWQVKYETHHCICLNDAVFCIAV